MSHRRVGSFRHRRAAIVAPDDKERHALEGRLDRLGLTVVADALWSPLLAQALPEIVFFDVDSGSAPQPGPIVTATPVPLIAIVGSETPSRLDWMMQQRPDAYLLRPIRSNGVYTALVMGFHVAGARLELEARIDRLERRARSRHIVFAATARLMVARGLSEPEAYRLLREAAMRDRTTVEVVSARLAATDPSAPSRRVGS